MESSRKIKYVVPQLFEINARAKSVANCSDGSSATAAAVTQTYTVPGVHVHENDAYAWYKANTNAPQRCGSGADNQVSLLYWRDADGTLHAQVLPAKNLMCDQGGTPA